MIVGYEKPTERFVESVRNGIDEEVAKASNPVEKGNYFLKWILTKVYLCKYPF